MVLEPVREYEERSEGLLVTLTTKCVQFAQGGVSMMHC